MFRKLIFLAITSGLARKMWDSYRRKGSAAKGHTTTGSGSSRMPKRS